MQLLEGNFSTVLEHGYKKLLVPERLRVDVCAKLGVFEDQGWQMTCPDETFKILKLVQCIPKPLSVRRTRFCNVYWRDVVDNMITHIPPPPPPKKKNKTRKVKTPSSSWELAQRWFAICLAQLLVWQYRDLSTSGWFFTSWFPIHYPQGAWKPSAVALTIWLCFCYSPRRCHWGLPLPRPLQGSTALFYGVNFALHPLSQALPQ